MKAELLDILICPFTQKELQMLVFQQAGDEIQEGILWTDSSWYAIYDEVPRMVEERWFPKQAFAQKYIDKLPEAVQKMQTTYTDGANSDHEQTISVFTNEWGSYTEVGWDDAMETFAGKTHFDSENLKNKWILDVGCGNGRFSYAASQHDANVVGIDLNGAIGKAYQNLKQYGIRCVQADILNLPFKPEVFDFIFSIGVLHHTQDTENAFKGLVPKLKAGGKVSTTYYRKGTWMRELTDNGIRFFTTRIPDKWVWNLSYIPSALAKFFRLIPLFPYQGRWIHVDQVIHTAIVHMRPQHDICYDWWAPKIANRFSKKTVHQWYEDMKLKEISEIYYGPGAVAFKATK